jgi:hypothetical protein
VLCDDIYARVAPQSLARTATHRWDCAYPPPPASRKEAYQRCSPAQKASRRKVASTIRFNHLWCFCRSKTSPSTTKPSPNAPHNGTNTIASLLVVFARAVTWPSGKPTLAMNSTYPKAPTAHSKKAKAHEHTLYFISFPNNTYRRTRRASERRLLHCTVHIHMSAAPLNALFGVPAMWHNLRYTPFEGCMRLSVIRRRSSHKPLAQRPCR